MNREQLEHLIRAAGSILQRDEVIVVGSQAILATVPEGLPREAVMSAEADVMTIDDPSGDMAMQINGSIGELTQFQETFGYYAEGVQEADWLTHPFPPGWRERLVPVNTPGTNGVIGWCLEPYDLCIAKLRVGREKDLRFVASLLQSGHIKPAELLERGNAAQLSKEESERVLGLIHQVAPPGRRNPTRHLVREAEEAICKSEPPEAI